MSAQSPLISEILGGESFELRILAAQGILPLPPSELIPLQVLLAADEDQFIAESAKSSLAAIDRKVASVFLATDAPPEVLRYFATQVRDSMLVDAVIRRRDVDRELLFEIAPDLPADLQEVLLLRQDAIVELPRILDALETNQALTPYSRRRVLEYREHLLPAAAAPAAVDVESTADFAEEAELTTEDLEELERVRERPAGGESDRRTGLSEHQIRALPVPVRLKLTRGASRTLRSILIRDLNPNIALSVLTFSAITEDEVEQLAGSRAVVDEVLIAIAKRRDWVSRYSTCLNLVRNPRLPVGTAVKLVARLGVRDLRNLGRDRNIPDAVRSMAQRLYRIKAT